MISDRISDDIPPQMKNLNIVIPILMYFLTINIEKMHCFFSAKRERHQRRKTRRYPITSDVAHDVGFPTVYRRINRRKVLMLSNQTSRYIFKCIRMLDQNTSG